jgi:hypothetical protein
MDDYTVLSIEGLDFPAYSQRGLVQSLTMIDQAKGSRRTLNGVLVNVVDSQFRKYASSISNGTVEGTQPPAFDIIYPGQVLTVGCIAELCQKLSSTELDTESELSTESYLSRTAVEGSIRYEDGFVFYRPVLSMMVKDYSVELDEWQAVVSWNIDLEEV